MEELKTQISSPILLRYRSLPTFTIKNTIYMSSGNVTYKIFLLKYFDELKNSGINIQKELETIVDDHDNVYDILKQFKVDLPNE